MKHRNLGSGCAPRWGHLSNLAVLASSAFVAFGASPHPRQWGRPGTRRKDETMKKRLNMLILAGMVLGMQIGCATWVAVRMPGPVNDEAIEVGMHRGEVEGYLGVAPASQHEDHGKTIARYEYSDGPGGGGEGAGDCVCGR